MLMLTDLHYTHNNIQIDVEEMKSGTVNYSIFLKDETGHLDLLTVDSFSNISDLYDVLGKVVADTNARKEQE